MTTDEAVMLLWTEVDMCATCHDVRPYICAQHAKQLRALDDGIDAAIADLTGPRDAA